MMHSKFVSELFRQQEMYSMVSTRQIFDKLAHSSIMKLNETSMNKLFDLMLMGVKYQVLMTTSPEEVYHIVLTHLTEVANLIKGSPVEALVNDAITQLKVMVKDFKAYDFMIIKQVIMRFFQDKHIKVSLFIQDSIQSLDGTIFLNFAEEGTLYSRRPGSVKYVQAGSEA